MVATSKRNVAFRFRPDAEPFAELSDPKVSETTTMRGMQLSMIQPNVTSGVCLSFPVEDFKVTDKKCVRNFRKFVQLLSESGREFSMELSDDLMDSVFNDHTRASLWFVGYIDNNTGVIGITWD